jgi:hypothetical protein
VDEVPDWLNEMEKHAPVAPVGSWNRWRHSPALIGLAIYAATTFAVLLVGARLSGGHLIYPLDDVYIHMAVAKNFATHGVWGVSPYEFSSATSSPLYILLLASVFKITGPNEWAALALSWTFGAGAVLVAARLMKDYLTAGWRTAAVVGFILLTPVYGLGVLGMEHSPQLLFTLLFLRQLARDDGDIGLLGLLAALMVGVRYEGVLVAAAATLYLLLRRRFRAAAMVVGCAWLPAAIYAWFSLRHGAGWLPNSVALKGVTVGGLGLLGQLSAVADRTWSNVERAPYLVFLAVVLLAMAWHLRRGASALTGWLFVTAVAIGLHLLTADVGWAFRYDAYLVGTGLVVASCGWGILWRSRKQLPLASDAVSLLVLAILIYRAGLAAILLPQFPSAIYKQQWQIAQFLRSYPPGVAVAANDVGAINFVNDVHCLDLVGLSSASVYQARRSHTYTTGFLESEAATRRLELAVVYDSWFTGGAGLNAHGPELPRSWIRVRRWTVPRMLQLGDRTVSFYAMSPAGAAALDEKLSAFEPNLPLDITVTKERAIPAAP